MPLTPVLFSLSAAALSAVVFFLLLRRLLSPPPSPSVRLDWVENFSVARYRPMLRLLSERDARFLAEAGMAKSAIRRFRAERRSVFLAYLDDLRKDFEKLHYFGRLMLVCAREERHGLATVLFQLRWRFRWLVLLTYCQLGMHALGWGSIDPRPLLASLDAIALRIRPAAAVSPGA